MIYSFRAQIELPPPVPQRLRNLVANTYVFELLVFYDGRGIFYNVVCVLFVSSCFLSSLTGEGYVISRLMPLQQENRFSSGQITWN